MTLTSRHCPAIICAALCLLLAAPLHAQDRPKVELTPDQIRINNQAVTLLKEDPPRAKEAIKLVQAALLMGQKADLLVLTLGRAYHMDGQCELASAQFDKVMTSPQVAGLPQAFVSVRLDKYRQEMRESCPGQLVISCSAPDIMLSMDSKKIPCNETLSLPAGTYALDAQRASTGAKISVEAKVSGMEITELKIDLGEPVTPSTDSDTAADTTPPDVTPPDDERGGVTPPQETLLSRFSADISLPLGVCVVELYVPDRAPEASLTDLNVCAGIALNIEERYALSESFSIGGRLGYRGLLGVAAGDFNTINYAEIFQNHIDLSLKVWPTRALAIDLMARLQVGSDVDYGTAAEEEDGEGRFSEEAALFLAPGLFLDLHELNPTLPRLTLGGRWMPSFWTADFDQGLYPAGFSLQAEAELASLLLSLSYTTWQSSGEDDAFGPQGDQSVTYDHAHEQILLGVGYRFSRAH